MARTRRSREEIILACKEGGCPWDYRNAPITVWRDKYGGTWWLRSIRCRDCGSRKIRKYEPKWPLVPRGSWKYERIPGWYDVEFKVYWQHATDERVRLGHIPLRSSPPQLKAVKSA